MAVAELATVMGAKRPNGPLGNERQMILGGSGGSLERGDAVTEASNQGIGVALAGGIERGLHGLRPLGAVDDEGADGLGPEVGKLSCQHRRESRSLGGCGASGRKRNQGMGI